jgi:hypothetical protein
MPINNIKQAQIVLSKRQMAEIGSLSATPGARIGCRIEETNLENTIAVISIPGKQIHLITHNGLVHPMGTEGKKKYA